VWLAPAICAAIILGFELIAALWAHSITIEDLGGHRLAELHDNATPERVVAAASAAHALVGVPFAILVWFTQLFYALDSIFGERRDRSILFWKSLPVSDAEAVLAKLTVAAVIMPAAAAVALVATQLGMSLIASVKLGGLGFLQGVIWSPAVWGGSLLVTLYLLLATAVWYLPLLGWYLLVSAWAPRSPLMYATLPPSALMLAEWIVFRTHYVSKIVFERVGNLGMMADAFDGFGAARGFGFIFGKQQLEAARPLYEYMRPAYFLASPDVWLGVLVAAGFVAGAIWVRRNRDEAA
jgi:ABC-2 type transport system permease protein